MSKVGEGRNGSQDGDRHGPTVPGWLGDRRHEWLVDVADWLRDMVRSLRLGSVLDITSVRERPWGAVLRVTTSDRIVYFKAEGFGGYEEPMVLSTLARQWPDLVPDVLAAEGRRSWLLMADHGRPMWDVLDTVGQLATLERLLPLYARVQESSAESIEDWIKAGVPDRRVHRLPELLDSLPAGRMAGGPLPMATEQRRAIDTLLPDLGRVCEELQTMPIAEALDHGDLHGGNILVNAAGQRLADWGDACVGHPFSSLFVTCQLVVRRFGCLDRAAAALRLRDAYLDAWSAHGSLASLREMFTLALWVGQVSRALNFAHMVEGATGALIDEWQGHIAAVLRQWQESHAHLRQPEKFLAVLGA